MNNLDLLDILRDLRQGDPVPVYVNINGVQKDLTSIDVLEGVIILNGADKGPNRDVG